MVQGQSLSRLTQKEPKELFEFFFCFLSIIEANRHSPSIT